MELVAATGNQDKLLEFSRILEPLGIQVISLAQLGVELDVEETGETFAENARIKVEAIWKLTGKAAVADDSGLCVDALEGRPGVLSARYCGENTPYPEKMAALLQEMDGVHQEQRTAQFACAICCVMENGDVLESKGICSGHIGYKPMGSGGFGYDPIFMVSGKSFSQLLAGEKDKVSHRGKALRQFAKDLQVYLQSKNGE